MNNKETSNVSNGVNGKLETPREKALSYHPSDKVVNGLDSKLANQNLQKYKNVRSLLYIEDKSKEEIMSTVKYIIGLCRSTSPEWRRFQAEATAKGLNEKDAFQYCWKEEKEFFNHLRESKKTGNQ